MNRISQYFKFVKASLPWRRSAPKAPEGFVTVSGTEKAAKIERTVRRKSFRSAISKHRRTLKGVAKNGVRGTSFGTFSRLEPIGKPKGK